MSCRRTSAELAYAGFSRFIAGLGKKMILANTMGEIANAIFGLDLVFLSPALAWLGTAAYSFQILYDFSGYSDMAIGLGLIFGFHFPENFNYPYISRSVTEFWNRWHISLGSWFRDYVYIPLGGNRKGIKKQILNILTVWALTGLWHGASWNFVIWGLYFAALLIAEKLFLERILKRLWAPLSHFYAIVLIMIGWVIFNSSDPGSVFDYLSAMFAFDTRDHLAPGYVWFFIEQYKAEFILCIAFSTPIAKKISARFQVYPAFQVLHDIFVIAILLVSIMYMVNTSFNPFIYFRF